MVNGANVVNVANVAKKEEKGRREEARREPVVILPKPIVHNDKKTE